MSAPSQHGPNWVTESASASASAAASSTASTALAFPTASSSAVPSGSPSGFAGLGSKKGIIGFEEGFNYISEHGIRPFLHLVQTNQPDGFKAGEFVKLYDLIFSMCIQKEPHNWSEELYNRYTHVISMYYLQNLRPSLRLAVQQIDDSVLLRAWVDAWKQHTLIEKGLSRLFMYLDRFFAPNNSDTVLPLSIRAGCNFYNVVFKDIVDQVTLALLRCIARERQGEEQDRVLLRGAVQVYVEMGAMLFRSSASSRGGRADAAEAKQMHHRLELYRQLLEAPVLQETSQWYEVNSQLWLEQDSCPTYLAKVEHNVKLEIDRVKSFLHPSSISPITDQIYKHTLKYKRDEILQKPTGLVNMLSSCTSLQAQEDLSRLYRLYSIWNDVGGIADAFSKQVALEGSSTVEDTLKKPGSGEGGEGTDNFALIRQLVALHSRYHEVVVDCFRSAQPFHVALTKAFEQFVNLDTRVTKQLAKFVHEVLKKGSRVDPIESAETTMQSVVFLYGYIRDKDIFEREYQQHLASRLLNNDCESEHNEKMLIGMFKTQCGYQWTYQLEGMFKDMQMSQDLQGQFGEIYSREALGDIQFNIKVCTPGCWPSADGGDRNGEANEGCLTTTPSTVKLPEALVQPTQAFRTFYLDRHSGRELDFCLAKGMAEVKVAFSPQTIKTLVCTTYQMIILLAFNGYRYVTLPQLISLTGLPLEEISEHLISLCHPKVNVLLKRPAGALLDDKCKFMINGRYNNPLLKIVVPLLRLKTKATPNATSKSVQVQRRCMVDAAIVRVLKTRREIRHNLLVAEVVQQLQARFEVKTSFVKERLEALMDDYLERSPNDRSVYVYKL